MLQYIVISHQYNRDSSIPPEAPRFVDESPKEAIRAAREVFDKDRLRFVESVVIYVLAAGVFHLIEESMGNKENPPKTIRYYGLRDRKDDRIAENFYGDFKQFEEVSVK
jgi:hypothetical protein